MRKTLLLLTFIFSVLTTSLAGGGNVGPEVEKGPAIRYYPNPISTKLNIEIELDYLNQYKTVEVKIINLLGQEMIPMKRSDLTAITNEIQIDMSDVAPGVYFMEVYSSVNATTVKQTRKITKR